MLIGWYLGHKVLFENREDYDDNHQFHVTALASPETKMNFVTIIEL